MLSPNVSLYAHAQGRKGIVHFLSGEGGVPKNNNHVLKKPKKT